jgi:GNAT superfamily N-acetyltransferase
MTMLDLRFRVATVADAAGLAAFAERTFRETFGPHNRPEDIELYVPETYGVGRQRSELADPDRLTLLAEDGAGLVAYAQLVDEAAPACVRGPRPIEVRRFYVDGRWHGRGVAQRLMAEVAAAAVRRGARTLHLAVWEHNARAIAFYRKQGFAPVGAKAFILGTDHQTDLIVARGIGA